MISWFAIENYELKKKNNEKRKKKYNPSSALSISIFHGFTRCKYAKDLHKVNFKSIVFV